jgi:hypothetical protein
MESLYKKQYLLLRRIIGVIGIIMPLVLLFGCLLLNSGEIAISFSDTYYTPMRDHFVGTLFVIGFFIGAYKGYDLIDRVVCLIIGISAVMTALIPTPLVGHYIFAGLVFLGMAYMSAFLFTKTDKYYVLTKRKLKRNMVYRICGAMIVLFLIMIGLTFFIEKASEYKLVFWIEWGLLWAFSIPWIIKGQTLLKDKI